MKTLVLGTAGHVDHGKTTLVRALTGVDTDRFREEKERGLTIDIGFAHLELPGDVQLGIVDVPGHRDFLGNMLTGTTGLDTVLLVVSAAEGPMPQTTEHLQIAALLGIRDGVVVLTNVDRVEPGFADLAEDAVREELRAIIGHDDWPIVRVDALRGEGVDELRGELESLVSRLPAPRPDPVFRLPVDRSFSISGTGTVVTGTAWTGAVETGDRLRILPAGREVRVRSLQVHGEDLQRVEARRRCAAGLVGATVEEVGRGDTLISHAAWKPATRVGVAFRMLESGRRTIEHGTRLRVWVGTREVMARIELPGRGVVLPGEEGFALLDCESDVVVRAGDRCILRFYSPVELLGGARVAELDPPYDWERRTAAWAAILGDEQDASVAAAVRLAGGRGIDRDGLLLAIPHPIPDAIPVEWGTHRIGDRWFAPERLDELEEALEAWLRREHAAAPRTPALPLESLRAAAAPDDAGALVEAAIESLAASGRVVVDGPEIRLADHRVELSERERELRAALLAEIRGAGLMPPDPAELTERLGASRDLLNDLLRLLVDDGEIVQVTPELYLVAAAERSLRVKALEVLSESDAARPTDFREALGVTRRYLIPLLEYLDGIGWTRRTGEGRIAGPDAEDMGSEAEARR